MVVFDARNLNPTWTKGEFPRANGGESVVTVSLSDTASVLNSDHPSEMPDSGKQSGNHLSKTPDSPDSWKKSHGQPSETPDSVKSISPVSKYLVLPTSSTPTGPKTLPPTSVECLAQFEGKECKKNWRRRERAEEKEQDDKKAMREQEQNEKWKKEQGKQRIWERSEEDSGEDNQESSREDNQEGSREDNREDR